MPETDKSSPAARYRVAMAVATVEVLEAFKSPSEELTLAEVARCTSASKPTVLRVLATLQQLGYVKRDIDSGRYFLSLKVLEFAKYVRRANSFRLWALPYMRKLMIEFGCIVNLAVREGTTISYIEVVTPSNASHVPPHPGFTARLHTTALGKAIAAFMPEAEVLEILEKTGMQPATPNTIVDKQRFLAELEGVRRRGFAEDREENLLGIACLATPIRDASGRAIAAISLTSRPNVMASPRKVEMAETLRQLGQELSLKVAGNLALSRQALAR